MPSSPATSSGERSAQIPTRTSGPTPRAASACASASERRSSSAYVTLASPATSATASGVREACSANSSCTQRAGAGAFPVVLHSVTTRRRSAGSSSSISESRRSGSAAIPSRIAASSASIRSIVEASNSSARHARAAARPPPSSRTSVSVRSNLAVASTDSTGDSSTSPRRGTSRTPSSSSVNITWKSGVWPRLRSGASSSTSRSKGMSWW